MQPEISTRNTIYVTSAVLFLTYLHKTTMHRLHGVNNDFVLLGLPDLGTSAHAFLQLLVANHAWQYIGCYVGKRPTLKQCRHNATFTHVIYSINNSQQDNFSKKVNQ